MMEGSTENRTPLVSTGDLDGRILDLSSDGQWLLFSRTGRSTEINGLWMLNLSDWSAEPISMRVSNVLHFASWLPGDTRRIIYSTVEPSDQAPGWKAQNDLRMQFVSDTGMLLTKEEIIRLMVGREMTNQFPPKKNQIGDVLLDVKNFSGMYSAQMVAPTT